MEEWHDMQMPVGRSDDSGPPHCLRLPWGLISKAQRALCPQWSQRSCQNHGSFVLQPSGLLIDAKMQLIVTNSIDYKSKIFIFLIIEIAKQNIFTDTTKILVWPASILTIIFKGDFDWACPYIQFIVLTYPYTHHKSYHLWYINISCILYNTIMLWHSPFFQ